MDESLPDFYRTARKMPHKVKRPIFSKSSIILINQEIIIFQLFFMSPKIKITQKRKLFPTAEFSARRTEKFCQVLARANCEDKMNSSAKNIRTLTL